VAGEFELVLRAPRAVTAAGEAAACVAVRDGRVAAVEPLAAGLAGRRTVTVTADEVLLPGLVDSHVHVNEPGRTDWEGFASATRAAAAGGITTLVDMPLNSIPPTTDVAALEAKRKAADGQLHVDVAFWGGAVPGNAGELRGLHDAGVVGFKAFLVPSGVDEFPPLDPAELERRLDILAAFPAVAAVHAEDARWWRGPRPRPAGATPTSSARGPARPRTWPWPRSSRPPRATGARAHVLHLSSSDTLPMLASARRDGVRVSAETCPHYLTFDAETIADGATQLKCCPPIREAENRGRSGRGWPRASSTWWCRTTRPARPSSSAWTPATSGPPGAASPRSS
jgi:allantoinase